MAAAGRGAPSRRLCLTPSERAGWAPLDCDGEGPGKLEGPQADSLPRAGWRDCRDALEDGEETVWVSQYGTGKLCGVHIGEIRCYGGDGSFGQGPESLYEDRAGSL